MNLMTTPKARPRTPFDSPAPAPFTMRGARLRKHADYQRTYHSSRKHFSATMAYFFSLRVATPSTSSSPVVDGPRIGLTVGKVLGKAVDRNRIKRRMREAVRRHLSLLQIDVDVILHPRKSVLLTELSLLETEVERIFVTIAQALKRDLPNHPPVLQTPGMPR